MSTFQFVTPKMLRAIATAKQEVKAGFIRSYSTEPGQVWFESLDGGYYKAYDEEDDYPPRPYGSNDTLSDC